MRRGGGVPPGGGGRARGERRWAAAGCQATAGGQAEALRGALVTAREKRGEERLHTGGKVGKRAERKGPGKWKRRLAAAHSRPHSPRQEGRALERG